MFKGDVGGGISRDDFIDSVAADILAKMPKPFEVFRIKKQLMMSLTPTGVVLLQELDRYNALVELIERTLVLLRKAIAGEIGMDQMLDNVATSLFNGQLPAEWRKLAPATCKQLGGWMEHLKVVFLSLNTFHILLNKSNKLLSGEQANTNSGQLPVNRWSFGCLVCTFPKVS